MESDMALYYCYSCLFFRHFRDNPDRGISLYRRTLPVFVRDRFLFAPLSSDKLHVAKSHSDFESCKQVDHYRNSCLFPFRPS